MNEPAAILVTGASRGLGRGIAVELARGGLSVGIHYGSNREAAEATALQCQSLAKNTNQRFPLIPGNLADRAQRVSVIPQALAALGRLDALVNNAGIAPRVRADITESTEESFDEVLDVNLKAPYFLSQAAGRHWMAHPNGSFLKAGYKLVFISSISAETASVNRGEYCIAKAGIGMVNQLWAVRLAGEGIQTVEFRPGIMATDMTAGVKEKYDKLLCEGLVPQNRWGEPSDVGLAVRSFIEGDFPFSTGEVIHLDGGFHLRRL